MTPTSIENPIVNSPYVEPTRHFVTSADRLRAVQQRLGIRAIYDLSATPFFLRGSGYPEGTLFPLVVSDFSLIDAIESGILKVPRVPVADDSVVGDLPKGRDLWVYVSDRETAATGTLPKELERLLQVIASSGCPHEEPAGVPL